MNTYFNFIKNHRVHEPINVGKRFIENIPTVVIKSDNKFYEGTVSGYFWYRYNDTECFLELFPTEQAALEWYF